MTTALVDLASRPTGPFDVSSAPNAVSFSEISLEAVAHQLTGDVVSLSVAVEDGKGDGRPFHRAARELGARGVAAEPFNPSRVADLGAMIDDFYEVDGFALGGDCSLAGLRGQGCGGFDLGGRKFYAARFLKLRDLDIAPTAPALQRAEFAKLRLPPHFGRVKPDQPRGLRDGQVGRERHG
jgi:hypothetical protein